MIMNIVLIEIVCIADQGHFVVKWNVDDVQFPRNFCINIIITNLKTGENFIFKNIEFSFGVFKLPYALPDGVYEAKMISSEKVKIVSKFKRFSINTQSETLIESPNDKSNVCSQLPIPVFPKEDIEFTDNSEGILFEWDYFDSACICFEIFVRNRTDSKILLRKKGISSEKRQIYFEADELSSLIGVSLEWFVKAVYFSRDRVSQKKPFKLLEDLKQSETADEAINESLKQNATLSVSKKSLVEYVNLHKVGVRFRRNNALNNNSLQEKLFNFILFRNRPEQFWALKDISFILSEGDVLGVIGNNGAGKSTLLKILNSVLFPDTGKIIIKGKVSALLSLGAGFLPNLTGRENIFLNGTFLGLSRFEINNLFEEIVEFSELGCFIDTQIKYYSSGMKTRLGFSIAVHVEPEILIIDEILSAGDKDFRQKAQSKMAEFMNSAKTMIVASHSMNFISNIATKAIYLKQGQIADYGKTDKVIDTYLSS